MVLGREDARREWAVEERKEHGGRRPGQVASEPYGERRVPPLPPTHTTAAIEHPFPQPRHGSCGRDKREVSQED